MDDLSTAVPAGLVEITTWSAKKRHYAADSPEIGSRYRDALCSRTPGWTRGRDQVSTDAEMRCCGLKRVVLADLPLCKRCERRAQQRQETP